MPSFASDNVGLGPNNIPPATIEETTLDVYDSLALFKQDNGSNGVVNNEYSPFVDEMITNRFERDGHVYMAGVTSSTPFQGATVAFFQLASRTLLWIADWTFCRWNNCPEIPTPTPSDSNWILLDDHYEPVMITLGEDGVTPLYRISGTYVYGHLNPSANITDNINFPRPPWLLDKVPRNVPSDKLEKGIIDGTGSTGGSPSGGTTTQQPKPPQLGGFVTGGR